MRGSIKTLLGGALLSGAFLAATALTSSPKGQRVEDNLDAAAMFGVGAIAIRKIYKEERGETPTST